MNADKQGHLHPERRQGSRKLCPGRLYTTLRTLLLIALLCGGLSFAKPAQAQSGVHTVAPGETLSEIAQRYGTDTSTLTALNGLSNPRVIWVGQRLSVPGYGQARAAASSGSGSAANYRVQPGDSLSELAAAAGISLQELAARNGIAPLTRLIVGQALYVPGYRGGAAGGSVAQAAQQSGQFHVVGPGESLGAIAGKFGVTLDALARLNGITNPSLVQVGQRLAIPSGAVYAASTARSDGFPAATAFPPTGGKWIQVDLSAQRATAYIGAAPQRTFVISSGLPDTPTVTGTFRIWAKLAEQDMQGGSRFAGTDYLLSDVPWVQYFHQDYAFHGAYWHNSFGVPMSKGCINMRNEDAKWLFDWAGPVWFGGWQEANAGNPGTLVIVHQ